MNAECHHHNHKHSTMQQAPSQAHPQPSKHQTKSALLSACCLTLNLSLLGALNIQMESFLVSHSEHKEGRDG